MPKIKGQILAGTKVDRHGEGNSKTVLEQYAASFKNRRMPLNQHHDLSLPTIGYIENMRVVADDENPGNWHLIGDVFIEGDNVPSEFGGFSFSYTERLKYSQTQEQLIAFLPYPHYNNVSLIDDVFEDGFVSVGKIVRKEASPETVALIVSIAVAVIQPLWEDLYRSAIAPSVAKFFEGRFRSLKRQNISCDLLQHIDYCGHKAEVLFIPIHGKELECFSIEMQCQGMLMVSDYLSTLDINHVPVFRIILHFDNSQGVYIINAVHLADGSVKVGG